MLYKRLNTENKMFMNREVITDLLFEWEDNYLMNILLEKFDTLHFSPNNEEDNKDYQLSLNSLNSYISDFNRKKIGSDDFIIKMEEELVVLVKQFPLLSYREKYRINYYKDQISKSRRLIITGEAGIGKSYFLYKLEESLTKQNIPHLCIYCKYTKKIDAKVIDDILKKNSRFYFIVDGINELAEIEQNEFLGIISKLNKISTISIIVSYRTDDLCDSQKAKLEEKLINTYPFKGVSYESSIVKFVEFYGVEITKFIDVLETNNPLYIKMLYKMLSNKKIVRNEIGDLVQITYLLEKYIQSVGSKYWNETKLIGKYMYNYERDYIEYNYLKEILGNKAEEYVKVMLENNIIDHYTLMNEDRYFIKHQHLFDYLIARTMQKEITDLSKHDIIELINRKITSFSSISEAIIILLFDRYKQKDIMKALDIIKSSNLKSSFDISIFRKISLDKVQIGKIQKSLEISNPFRAFFQLGGYHNRPFNCVNYINTYIKNQNQYWQIVVPENMISSLQLKLKNALYNIILIDNDNEYIEEMFWYSMWLTSTPNQRIRLLAKKVLYDITNKYDGYSQKLIDTYIVIKDYYIRNAIVLILTSISKLGKNETLFIGHVLKNYYELSSENIYRISTCLNIDYINVRKKNTYIEVSKTDEVDNVLNLSQILITADLYEKHLFKFERFAKENEISLFHNFILNNKNEVAEWNLVLNQKFDCISQNGYCKYSFMKDAFKRFMPELNLQVIDNKKMFLAFQNTYIEVCKKYFYEYYENVFFDNYTNSFVNSTLKKYLLISQDLLLGSLMCNYYTDELSIYNDDENLGYLIYKPFILSEEEFNIITPVSLYSEDIDILNYKVEKELDLIGERDDNWYRDRNISLTNIKKLTNPIKYKGKEWSLIGGDIHQYNYDDSHNHIFTETYDFSISIDSPLTLNGDENSKYLTIIRDTYSKDIEKYSSTLFFKNTKIEPIEHNSYDFKETYLSFPPPVIIRELKLKFHKRNSTWIDSNGDIIIYCDNNPKKYYNNKITMSIYIQTEYLDKIKKQHNVKYWAYTEKSYMNEGWNQDACVHVELNSAGDIISIFNNDHLTNAKKEYNEECVECEFGIYQEMKKPFDLSKIESENLPI